MRRLIYIPIIHASADLGSLSKFVQAHYAKVCGKASWSQREDLVKLLWADIQTNILALNLDARKTRIYQDGLPICGFEEKIVRELANAGSSNHQLILKLLNQGAVLTGTEDPRLLMEEYELQKKHLARTQSAVSVAEKQTDDWDRILKGRDSFIAERIAHTLQKGARRGCFFWAPYTRWMRSDPPTSEWKRSETLYTKLYGGHGPRTTQRLSRHVFCISSTRR